jgi:hypothetical protein
MFDPRRFDLPDGQSPGGHRYAWFPFGAGPHLCRHATRPPVGVVLETASGACARKVRVDLAAVLGVTSEGEAPP